MEAIKRYLFQIWPIILAIFLTFLTIIIFYSGLTGNEVYRMLNSDIMYFPSIYVDVFNNGNTFKTWAIPGAPGFFPDMIFYFFLMFVTGGNIPLSAFLFGFIQFLVIVYLFTYIVELITGYKNKYLFLLINLFYLLFVLAGIFDGRFDLTFHVLTNTYHIGPFVNTLISVILLLHYYNKRKLKYLTYLVVLGAIAIVSDKLYMLMFSIPMLIGVALLVRKQTLKVSGIILGSIVFQMFLGILLFNGLRLSNWFEIRSYSPSNITFEKMVSSANVLFPQLFGYIKSGGFGAFVVIIPALIFIYFITIGLYRYCNKNRRDKNPLELLFIIYSLGFTFIVFLAPILLGDYVGTAKIRYNISVFYLGVLNIGFVLCLFLKRLRNQKYNLVLTLSFSSLLLIALLVKTSKIDFKSGLKNYFSFYPEQARVVDELQNKVGLKKGLATYWQAKNAWLFNNSEIRVYACLSTGHANTWIVNNSDWYFKEPNDTNDVFNFILFENGEDTTQLREHFGKPEQIFKKNNYMVLKYPDFVYDKSTKGPIFIKK